MRLALYQPDIPQNTGTIIRLCACMGIPLDIIEPCGFAFSSRELNRAALDYAPLAEIQRHNSWQKFCEWRPGGSRLILMTTKVEQNIYDFSFREDDILMMGSEQSGVPEIVHEAVDGRINIPMIPSARSLNIAVAAGIAVSEARRQVNIANQSEVVA